MLQGVGYVALLSGHHAIRTGWRAGIAGAALGIIAFLAVIGVGTLRARFLLRPLLVEMSRYIAGGTKMDHPRAALLPAWGVALGDRKLDGEHDLAFVRRVFGAENLVVDVVDGQTRLWTEPPLAGET